MEERVITEARRAVEAVVMAAIEPVEPQVLAQLVEIPVTEVEALCTELAEEYEREARGFTLVRVAGGYRFQTHPDMAPYVERFVLEGQTARLSAPALETLAIVAYKQPVSRAQLAAIRGVSVESTLSTLEQRGYVQEVGHDPGPGQAILYGTTQLFLERLGLDSLSDLPALAEFVPEPSVVEALERGLLLRTEPDAAPEVDADPEVAVAAPVAEVEAVAEVEVTEADIEAEAVIVDAPPEPVDPADAIAAEIDAEIEAEEAAEAREFVGATSDGEVGVEAVVDLAETAADLDDDDGWVMPPRLDRALDGVAADVDLTEPEA